MAQGINTEADLVASYAKGLRSQYGVVVEERRALHCAELSVEPVAKQPILSSRPFGDRVTGRGDVLPARAPIRAYQSL